MIAPAGRLRGLADRVEQRAHALEVHPIALVEIDLGLAGDDAGEMEDRVGPGRDELFGLARRREIAGHDVDRGQRLAPRGWRRLRPAHHVVQRELVDRDAVERAVGDEARGELAPDHARRAGDEDMHAVSPSRLRGYYRKSAGRPSRIRMRSTGIIERPQADALAAFGIEIVGRASVRMWPCAPANRRRSSRTRRYRGCAP